MASDKLEELTLRNSTSNTNTVLSSTDENSILKILEDSDESDNECCANVTNMIASNLTSNVPLRQVENKSNKTVPDVSKDNIPSTSCEVIQIDDDDDDLFEIPPESYYNHSPGSFKDRCSRLYEISDDKTVAEKICDQQESSSLKAQISSQNGAKQFANNTGEDDCDDSFCNYKWSRSFGKNSRRKWQSTRSKNYLHGNKSQNEIEKKFEDNEKLIARNNNVSNNECKQLNIFSNGKCDVAVEGESGENKYDSDFDNYRPGMEYPSSGSNIFKQFINFVKNDSNSESSKKQSEYDNERFETTYCAPPAKKKRNIATKDFKTSNMKENPPWIADRKGEVVLSIMRKMGYIPGKGLGANKQGIVEPIKSFVRPGRGALGAYGPERPFSPPVSLSSSSGEESDASVQIIEDIEEYERKKKRSKSASKNNLSNESKLDKNLETEIEELFLRWNAVKDVTHGFERLLHLKKTLGQIRNISSGFSQDELTPFDELVWKYWVPAAQRIVALWNPMSGATRMLKLINIWSRILPQWIKEHLFFEIILPRLNEFGKNWKPICHPPIDEWLHPWLEIMGNRLQLTCQHALQNLEEAMKEWNPVEPEQLRVVSITSLLVFFEKSLNRVTVDQFVVRNILPKLIATLQQIDFDLDKYRQTSEFYSVIDWTNVLGRDSIASILVQHFFPKLLDVLKIWVKAPDVPHNRVVAWFDEWKKRIPTDIAELKTVNEQIEYGSIVIRNARPSPSLTFQNRLPEPRFFNGCNSINSRWSSPPQHRPYDSAPRRTLPPQVSAGFFNPSYQPRYFPHVNRLPSTPRRPKMFYH